MFPVSFEPSCLRFAVHPACSLVPGILVYMVDRPPDRTYFIEKSHFFTSFYGRIPNLFGRLGNIIPEFVHVFAFILLTASLFPNDRKKYIPICCFWCVVDGLFEYGQKFGDTISRFVPGFLNGIPYFENTAGYFKRGTFDYNDILAILAGTVCAYATLLLTSRKK